MNASSYRLDLEEIEDRLTPSGSPEDVFNAISQIQTNTAILRFITNERFLSDPVTLSYVENFLKYVNDTSTTAVLELNGFVKTLTMDTSSENTAFALNVGTVISEGQFGLAYTNAFAGMLNISLVPHPPATLPFLDDEGGSLTIDLTSDSGMVGTLPTISGFTDLGDGVKTKDILTGVGNAASSNSTVSIYYTGWLAANGTVFDSQRSPESPASFGLAVTIAGFKEGVTGMQPGGIRQIFIPYQLGYGNDGFGTSVPGFADLVFEVKLISTT